MKKLLTALACALLLMALAVCACADGQEITVYRTNEPTTLDRVAATIDEAGKFILWDASEPLFRIEEGATVLSGAESYSYDEATMTYTFTLRDNKWQDGVKVTAQDYLYSFQRMVDPKNAYGYISDIYCIVNAEDIYAGKMDVSELGVSAPDEKTLVIQLNEITPAFLEVVPLYPQRQDFVEAAGDAYGIDVDKFISCGPFKLTAWEHNSYLTLEKNDQYWDADNVKLDKVTVLITNDAEAQYSAMLNGTLDYCRFTSSNYINTFLNDDRFQVEDAVLPTLTFVLFNGNDDLLKNAKIRQALSLAIDREFFVEAMYEGIYPPAYGLLSSAIGINGVALRDVAEEPVKALAEANPDPKALFIEGLTELGMDPDPSKITLTFSISSGATTDDTIALYQAMWGETLGVNVVADVSEWASFWSDCKAGDFQIGTLAWSGEVDISFLFNLFLTDSAQMPCFTYSSEFDELVIKANKSMDADERLALYAQAEKIMMADLAAIAPVCYRVQKDVLNSKIKGWDFNVFSTAGHRHVYLDD
ncbi:MAG: peptide ABC transporter substrate-binding protein [Clostridia bacterium]|nr:peptide ABC transporter substrate-binding protein [Clostridia bacterium]